jgi:hypothetical protein
MDFLALLATIVVACAGVWALGRLFGPPHLVELFRANHDPGWPVGVQEEDLPPPFGSAVPERPPRPAPPGPAVPDPPPARAWTGAVGSVRVSAGTARR